ncbi:MAG: hypothetical protein JRJ18_17495, partial [Deltaproteobacteria bacterium]|nr:hypothetical protein [Deltaproteobacteria bacterium]
MDFASVFNDASVSDDTGTLTASRLSGLGMGPDTVIASRRLPGGITYHDLEVLDVTLGSGGDTFFVEGTTKREDFQVWTLLHTGAGDDVVTVSLGADTDGRFALDTGSGDDTVDASFSSLPLVIFGGTGKDTIEGGIGHDILFGDQGRVDFTNAQGAVVTRLGTAPPTAQGTVESAAASSLVDGSAAFPVENGGLSGLRVVIVEGTGAGQSRLISSNTATELILAEAWDVVPDGTSRYRVAGVPRDQTDGTFRDPAQILVLDPDVGGDDVIRSSFGDDLVYGGAGHDAVKGGPGTDTLYGGSGDDILEAGWGAGDRLYGEAGQDVLYGSDDGADTLEGGSGNDRLFGLSGNDVMAGGPGDDIMEGGPGDDLLQGDEGSDLIVGGADHDILYGHNDAVSPDDDAVDYIYGDFGASEVTAGSGQDAIYGGGGNDLLFGEGQDDDIISGGDPSDLVNYGDPGDGSGFVTSPTPTPDPALGTDLTYEKAEQSLPAGVDEAGRWAELSGSAALGGVSGNEGLSMEPAVAANASGGRYVAWADNRNGNFEIYVAYHSGGIWQQLAGSAEQGGISDTQGASRRPGLILDGSGLPVVAWTERDGASSDIRAARYNPALNGGTGGWEALGDSLGASGISGTGAADRAVLGMVDGQPAVAWLDTSAGVAQVYVKRFDGAVWVELGTGSASGTGVTGAVSGVSDFAFAADGATAAVAWSETNGTALQIHVRELSGGTWTTTTDPGGLGDLTLESASPTMAYHAGDLFVAWEQQTSSVTFDREIYAARYDHVAGTWTEAGTGAWSGGGVSMSPDAAVKPKLAAGGGRLHLVWSETQITDGAVRQTALYAKVWDGTGFQEEVPGDASGQGIGETRSEALDVSVSVDSSGHPYVAWSEAGQGTSEIFVRGNSFDVARVFQAADATALQGLLDSEDLGTGDVVVVGPGTFAGDVIVGAGDAGVLVVGSPGLGTILTGSTNSDAAAVRDCEILGSGLTVTGGTGFQATRNRIVGSAVSLTLDGASGVGVLYNRVEGSGVGLRVSSAASGRVFGNDVAAAGTGVEIAARFDGHMKKNRVHGASLGVSYDAAAVFGEN